MTNLSVNMRAIVFVLVCFLVYNIADAFLNHVVDEYHFGTVAFYPLFSYMILLLFLSKHMGGLRQIPKTTKLKLHLYRGLFSAAGFLGFVIAIRYISLAQTYTLVLTSPFWVAIISILFLKKHVGWHRWLAIIIGFIGVLIVLQPGTQSLHWAAFGALSCGISAGLIMLIAKAIGDKEPMINLVFYPAAVITVIMACINSFWMGWELVKWEHMSFFAAAGIVFLLADIMFSKGFATGETDLLAPLHYSQIVWGALIGYFFFQEVPEIWTFIGASIIIASGGYLLYRESKAGTVTRKHCTTIHD